MRYERVDHKEAIKTCNKVFGKIERQKSDPEYSDQMEELIKFENEVKEFLELEHKAIEREEAVKLSVKVKKVA